MQKFLLEEGCAQVSSCIDTTTLSSEEDSYVAGVLLY